MKLFRCIKYGFSGGQTVFLQQKMQKFMPYGEESIHKELLQLYDMRQYMPFHTPTFQYFVSSIQKHYLKQNQFNRISLRIYSLMQKMQMMSDSTKKIFHKKVFFIQEFMRFLLIWRMRGRKRRLRIKDWITCYGGFTGIMFGYGREFPYQFRKFQDVASSYTVRLFETFQYMNSLPKVPAWEPYIRVSYMLKALGHDVQCRTDMFNLQVLQKISRHYFVYLIELFSKQMYPKFMEQMKMHNSLLEYLCDQYIVGDDIDYDKYLQRIEVIDNLSANEEVNRTMDAISWTDLAEGWRLAAHAIKSGCFTEMHDYKFSQIFWRKLQTQDIPIQQITRMLKIMIETPLLFFEKRQAMMLRMVESLYEKKDQQSQFFPARGDLDLLKMPQFLPMDGDSIRKITKFLYEKIPTLLSWEEDDIFQINQLIQKKDFEGKQKVIEFLRNKQNNLSIR